MKKFENIMIASDLDGTFISREMKEVERNIEHIRYFTENGGIFTFATGRIGRHLEKAMPNAKNYVNAPAVCCNGMELFDLGKSEPVRQHFVDRDMHYQVLCYLKERYPTTFFRTISSNGILTDQPDHYYVNLEKAEKTIEFVYADPEMQRESDLYKLTLRDAPDVLDRIREDVENTFCGVYDICKSWIDLMELMPKGISKATMLCELRDELSGDGVKKKLYAVGDHENDLEMLRHADVAVCPANAIDEVKSICDLCFCDNDSGVIADIIEYIDNGI